MSTIFTLDLQSRPLADWMHCWVSREKLAANIGRTPPRTSDALAGLGNKGLILRRKRGPGKSWDTWLLAPFLATRKAAEGNPEVPLAARQEAGSHTSEVPPAASPEGTLTARHEVPPPAPRTSKGNNHKEQPLTQPFPQGEIKVHSSEQVGENETPPYCSVGQVEMNESPAKAAPSTSSSHRPVVCKGPAAADGPPPDVVFPAYPEGGRKKERERYREVVGALASEHLSDHHPMEVERALHVLQRRGREPTLSAVEAHLNNDEDGPR